MSPAFILVELSKMTPDIFKIFQQLCPYPLTPNPPSYAHFIGVKLGSSSVFYWQKSEIIEPVLICQNERELIRAIAIYYTLGE